ncbi:addiction module HigA family antidote [Pedobacter sp. W3I1]|uniref:HigA family addiction module antitoxin n=1 Tax=Pedobacter sp. W3I1 TaxID=3042291 RepID=UPI002789308E|nr:HigA family addiction module antitoxin [Pedobacter sp. W3I1]MDQ0640060.1 addiction module HigA family antidote [Pedobacter sp. W3I1]
MEALIEKYKGIHPGMVLERELTKRGLKKRPFALDLHIYPQQLNELTKAKRGITAELAIKIDGALGLEEGTMFLLQAYYELKKAKIKMQSRPNFEILRNALFWDANIDQIDWQNQANWVIKRIFERGNDDEKTEISRFYGKKKIQEVTGSDKINGNQPLIMAHLRLSK